MSDGSRPADLDDAERSRIEGVYRRYSEADVQRRWSLGNPGNRALIEERVENAQRLLDPWLRQHTGGLRVLDIGCGTGGDLELLGTVLPSGARTGVDLRRDAVTAAAARIPAASFCVASATALPVGSSSVDLVLLSTVFSSMLDDHVRRAAADEVVRVLVPGGAVLWYDMRVQNPRNHAIRPVGRRELASLFSSFRLTVLRSTVVPGLARRLPSTVTATAYRMLARVPLLKTHYSALLQKPLR